MIYLAHVASHVAPHVACWNVALHAMACFACRNARCTLQYMPQLVPMLCDAWRARMRAGQQIDIVRCAVTHIRESLRAHYCALR